MGVVRAPAAPMHFILRGLMLLDSYLAMKQISAADCGRAIGLKWPYSVNRYLQNLKNGLPNKAYRPPARWVQLAIRKWTGGRVGLNDWPEPASPPEDEA